MALNVKRERIIGAAGLVFGLAVGWHEGFGGSLASWTAGVLTCVSLGMLLSTVPVHKRRD